MVGAQNVPCVRMLVTINPGGGQRHDGVAQTCTAAAPETPACTTCTTVSAPQGLLAPLRCAPRVLHVDVQYQARHPARYRRRFYACLLHSTALTALSQQPRSWGHGLQQALNCLAMYVVQVERGNLHIHSERAIDRLVFCQEARLGEHGILAVT